LTELVTAMKWLGSRDTGISSTAIMRRMFGDLPEAGSYPHDPADLGRCVRLLDLLPSWRDRIGEMSAVGEVWDRLAQRWIELERLYREELTTGRCPRTYELMKQLRGST
jgi:hypothetical protein